VNVVVEWLTLLLRIREVPGSNLSPETAYPESGSWWFSSDPPGKYEDSALKLGHNTFQILSNSSFTHHPSFSALYRVFQEE
jgi:hypothetical protein